MSDQSLAHRIKSGDKSAFEELFNSHYQMLCIYAKKVIGDMDQSRDIVQNVFVTLYNNHASLNIKSPVKNYLYRSVYNACLNYLEQVKVHSKHHSYIASYHSESDSRDMIVQAELEGQVWNEIQKLPDQCRIIFQMNRFEGRKNKEIATTLGISTRTVETQISKALKILRKNLSHLMPALLLLTSAA